MKWAARNCSAAIETGPMWSRETLNRISHYNIPHSKYCVVYYCTFVLPYSSSPFCTPYSAQFYTLTDKAQENNDNMKLIGSILFKAPRDLMISNPQKKEDILMLA